MTACNYLPGKTVLYEVLTNITATSADGLNVPELLQGLIFNDFTIIILEIICRCEELLQLPVHSWQPKISIRLQVVTAPPPTSHEELFPTAGSLFGTIFCFTTYYGNL